jgi:hypothetical protein
VTYLFAQAKDLLPSRTPVDIAPGVACRSQQSNIVTMALSMRVARKAVRFVVHKAAQRVSQLTRPIFLADHCCQGHKEGNQGGPQAQDFCQEGSQELRASPDHQARSRHRDIVTRRAREI